MLGDVWRVTKAHLGLWPKKGRVGSVVYSHGQENRVLLSTHGLYVSPRKPATDPAQCRCWLEPMAVPCARTVRRCKQPLCVWRFLPGQDDVVVVNTGLNEKQGLEWHYPYPLCLSWNLGINGIASKVQNLSLLPSRVTVRFSILDFSSQWLGSLRIHSRDPETQDDMRNDLPSMGTWPRLHSNSRDEQRSLFPSFSVTRGQAAVCFLLLTSQVKNELSSS